MHAKRYHIVAAVIWSGLAGVLILLGVLRQQAAAAALQPSISLSEIRPRTVPNSLDMPLTIYGSQFQNGAQVSLGNLPLQDTTWVSSTLMTATLPWNSQPGVYTLTVRNPGGAFAGLADALTVTRGMYDWTSTGPDGGRIDWLVENPQSPDTIYAAGTRSGLFRTRDGGHNWQMIFGVKGWGMSVSLAGGDPDTLYVASGYTREIYRSDDSGDTWQIISVMEEDEWHTIVAHPALSTTVFVHSTYGGLGLLKSIDRGQSWVDSSQGITETGVSTLAFHPLDPDIMAAGTNQGNVFISQDGGETWQFASKAINHIRKMAFNPYGAHELWLSDEPGTANGVIVKSTDGGFTDWTTIILPNGKSGCFSSIRFSPWVSGTVSLSFASSYESLDGGLTWNKLSLNGMIKDVLYSSSDEETRFLAVSDGGVLRSNDNGLTWEASNKGITAMVASKLEAVPNTQAVFALFYNIDGVFRSQNAGHPWQRVNDLGVGSISALAVDPHQPGRVYLGAEMQVLTSQDWGESWPLTSVLTVPNVYSECYSFINHLAVDPINPGKLLAGVHHICQDEDWDDCGNDGGLYRSQDYGEHWTGIDTGGIIQNVTDIAFDPSSPGLVFAASGNSQVLLSTDGGQVWGPSNAGLDEMPCVSQVEVEPSPPSRIVVNYGGGFFLSDDHGLSWSATGSPSGGSTNMLYYAPGSPPALYVSKLSGLYFSTNGGQNWRRAPGIVGQQGVYAMTASQIDPRLILYARASTGVYHYTMIDRWFTSLPLVIR